MSKLFKCKAENDHADIFLYGDIGDGWFGGVSSEEVSRELKSFNDLKTATVYVNSLGGNFFDGIAIRSSLMKLNAALNIVIDGVAASAATAAIAIPDVPIEMAAGSRYMIHDPWTIVAGGEDELRKNADILAAIKEDMVGIYDYRTNDKIDSTTITEMMTEETWLSAEDAVHYGFASEVSGEIAIAACATNDLIKSYMHVPKGISCAENHCTTCLEQPQDCECDHQQEIVDTADRRSVETAEVLLELAKARSA